jgi:uncharacterized membrane protein YdjX (TVP38/TMEM64 family)
MTALILNAIPGELWAALGAILAAAIAWLVGRRGGTQASKAKAAAKAADDLATAKDKRDEVDALSDDDVSKRLRKWHRK